VRRAVAEYVAQPDNYQRKADVTLSMSGETWVKLYLSQATAGELIQSGAIRVTGDSAEAARVLDLFDRYKPEKAVVIPPAYLDHTM
jgi:ubiquinone biosynthesis protein UbiJ